MSLRPNERTEVRRNRYKVAVDADEGRRRREDREPRTENCREESLQIRRKQSLQIRDLPRGELADPPRGELADPRTAARRACRSAARRARRSEIRREESLQIPAARRSAILLFFSPRLHRRKEVGESSFHGCWGLVH